MAEWNDLIGKKLTIEMDGFDDPVIGILSGVRQRGSIYFLIMEDGEEYPDTRILKMTEEENPEQDLQLYKNVRPGEKRECRIPREYRNVKTNEIRKIAAKPPAADRCSPAMLEVPWCVAISCSHLPGTVMETKLPEGPELEQMPQQKG